MAIFGITSALTIFAWNVLGLTSLAAAGMFANIVLGAALIGASYLTGSMRQPSMKTPQAQAVINQSTGPRVRGYGRALLGGTRAFFDSNGGGTLFQIVMMHSGEIEAIEHFKVGDIVVNLDPDGFVTNSAFQSGGRSQVRIIGHLGAANQPAEQVMVSNWSQWTTAHRLRGIAYFFAWFRSPKSEDFQKIFPESYNTPVRGLCRLSKVWDPRNNTTAWSDNSSLCILDYLTHSDGYRLTIDDIDVPSFAAFANLCDEPVPLAAGGTEKRYRLWGVYQLTEEPHAVLRKMLNTCDGELYQTPEGKVAIRGGKWTPPAVTLEAKDNLGHSMDQGNNRFAAFNELKIMYTSPQHDYQTMEATAWKDLGDQAERGPIPSDIDLDFVPSPTQARRLAKIHQAKSNPRWKGKLQHNISGLNALGERTVRAILPELEIDDAFYVAGIRPTPDLSSVEIDVLSINQAAYDWSVDEEGENPPIPQDTSPDLDFPVPQNLTLSNPASGVVIATVDEPGREGLTLEVQIRAGAGSNWVTMDTESQTTARETQLADGAYQAQARWMGPQNVVSSWSFPLAEITIPVPEPEPEE